MNFGFRLYNDFFTLLDPTGDPLGNPAFSDWGVPQRIRNVILEAQDDIIVPAHTVYQTLHLHGQKWSLPRPVAETHVTRWRLMSDGDLTFYYQSPVPAPDNPSGEQLVIWEGKFILSYHRVGGDWISSWDVQEFFGKLFMVPQPNTATIRWYFAADDQQALLPDMRSSADLNVSWESRKPDDPTAFEALLHFTHGLLLGEWAF